MAAHLLYVHNARALLRERVFRDRSNPLDLYDDNKMYKRYRFTRRGVMHVIDLLEPHLTRNTMRSKAIDGRLQVFIALRFYATGCVYTSSGDRHGVSEASVCRVVRDVTNYLASIVNEHVVWPSTPAAKTATYRGFYQKSRFPRVIGAVDCTHIKLDSSPLGAHEYVYVNRKGWKSINVQLICDDKYKITNVVARWPGSTHDSRILQNSVVGQQLAARHQSDDFVLGDSGYQQSIWLMTPLRNPGPRAERAYNRAHKSGRVVIEQVNGQIKQKFPCLRRGIRMAPDRACRVVVACCVLHNIAKDLQEPHLRPLRRLEEVDVPDYNGPANDNGNATRARLVATFFA